MTITRPYNDFDVEHVLASLTLDEKVSLLAGIPRAFLSRVALRLTSDKARTSGTLCPYRDSTFLQFASRMDRMDFEAQDSTTVRQQRVYHAVQL